MHAGGKGHAKGSGNRRRKPYLQVNTSHSASDSSSCLSGAMRPCRLPPPPAAPALAAMAPTLPRGCRDLPSASGSVSGGVGTVVSPPSTHGRGGRGKVSISGRAVTGGLAGQTRSQRLPPQGIRPVFMCQLRWSQGRSCIQPKTGQDVDASAEIPPSKVRWLSTPKHGFETGIWMLWGPHSWSTLAPHSCRVHLRERTQGTSQGEGRGWGWRRRERGIHGQRQTHNFTHIIASIINLCTSSPVSHNNYT